jgi:hypothetical protein
MPTAAVRNKWVPEKLIRSVKNNNNNIIIIIIIIIGIQPLGRSGQRPELSGDWYGSGTLHPGQILRGRLLSPAFRRSHFRHQVAPRPPRRERS